MTRAHRRYLAIETGMAAAINAILSLMFVLLVFSGRGEVPLAGRGGVIADALPQGFMIALMSCLVPTLLTRRRIAAGAVATMPTGRWIVRPVLARALLLAVAVAGLAWSIEAALLPPTGPNWRFATLVAFKCVSGAVLGAIVAAVSARAALADRPPATGGLSA